MFAPWKKTSLGDEFGLVAQLIELLICKMAVQKSRGETERYGQGDEKY